MNVTETKRTLKGLPPKMSVLLESGHGLGKSQVVAQTAAELSVETQKTYGFIDIRLSQREVGDIIGMPRGMDTFTISHKVFKNGDLVDEEVLAKNVSVNDIPFWFPTDPNSCGILFLDEINRATREVQQAAFELVLDYRLNFRDLPIGWRVVSAINENMDVYSVLGMDPALYDRFMVIPFKPTVPEWQKFAEDIGVHDAVLKYIQKFPSDLDTPEKIEPGKVYPSRRSWVRLSDAIIHMTQSGDEVLEDQNYLTLFAMGFLGQTVAINFAEFIAKDYKVYSAEDILNGFGTKMAEEFSKFLVTDITFYNKEIVNYVKKSKKPLSSKQCENLFRYYRTIPKEAASGFWSQFSKECRDIATKWYKSDPAIAKYTIGFLGKKSATA